MGIARVHHSIDYQKKVRIGNSIKRIDAYIAEPKVLIEQKSCGIDLNCDEEKITAHLFKFYAEKTKGE